jgi:Lrp/AsnC family transcriptional regulator
MNLDPADIRILGLLQMDASLAISEIADRVHLSQNACWRRIKQLEAAGYIRGRVAILDAVKLGVGTTVFIMIRAFEHSDTWLKEFAEGVNSLPEVVEMYRISGDVDYLLKLKVADIAAYDRVYKRLIRLVRLTNVSSSFVMEEIKSTTALPLSLA